MEIKNRNAFRLTRFILLKVSLLFRFLGRFRSARKRLLIIKTDAIGDYILFRNFLEIIKQSERYKDYKIDLLGNPAWKDIALQYDKDFVDEFIFVKTSNLYDAPFKTLQLGWRLFSNNYEVVLQPSSTRTFIIDGLAGLAAAKQTIGFESDNEGIATQYKLKTDKFYTVKLVLPAVVYFEFERSKFFFESVLKSNLTIRSSSIGYNDTGKRGIVIVPGAGIAKRCWEPGKFLELIKLILTQTNHEIYIEGSPVPIDFETALIDNPDAHRVHNLIGKTTLLQLIDVIGNALLVIANETSAIHIAAAAKTPSVCILSGGHFDRFVPYPAWFESKPLCIYEKMECFYCNWNCIYQTAESEPYPCLSQVNPERVWQAALPLIK